MKTRIETQSLDDGIAIMITLAATTETLAKAKESFKSCAFSYRGPETLRDGTDIIDALDRVITALSDAPPPRVAKLASVQVDQSDLYASAAALDGRHWLRSFLEREGFSLSPPAPQKMAFAR